MNFSKMFRSGAFKIFREAFTGYVFNVSGIIAGTIIALQLDIFSISPWSVATYPAILSARGIIGGLFSGRLSTALHLGTIYPKILKNTKSFHVLFDSVITLTFEVSLTMSVFSTVFGIFFWGVTFADFLNILAVILATMALGLFIALVTMAVSFISFKHGLDPDIFSYPAISAVSDILVTSFYIIVLSLFFSSTASGAWIVALLGFVLAFLTVHSCLRNFGDKEFLKTLKESFLTLIFVAITVNIAGMVFGGINTRVHVTGESQILIVYPALIAIIGSVGAVVGSTTTTKLAVGLLSATFYDMRNHLEEIFYAWAPSLIIFVFFSLLSLISHATLVQQSFLRFILLLLITNVIASAAVIPISYVVAILTFQKGLDPDNFVIPVESVLADSITSAALLLALFLVG